MVRKELTDYSTLRIQIVNATNQKISDGKFNLDLHDIFKPSKIKIDDVDSIIRAIDRKLRVLETIYYTFFESEFDATIMSTRSVPIGNKIIETEFNYSTKIIRNRIEIDNADSYEELINTNFQTFILTVASIYENIVKLIEIFVKKITVHGKTKQPYQSVHMGLFLEYWHNLVKLSYRKDDDFYECIKDHQAFLEKYLRQINNLRNRFIHGYSPNLTSIQGNFYVVSLDTEQFPLIAGRQLPPELILNEFVKDILENSQELIGDLLTLFNRKLNHHMTKIPM